jgi:ribonuclease VapC
VSSELVVDTSAILAILLREDDADRYFERLVQADLVWISAVTMVEAVMTVEGRLGTEGGRELEQFLRLHRPEVSPVGPEQVQSALVAFWRFGKGLHRARLNFGDCFSYAAAKTHGLPLLYKGGDFAQTDVISAIA